MDDREQQILEGGLRSLRAAGATLHAPPALEATLLAAFDRAHPRPWHARLMGWSAPLAGTACAVLAALVLVHVPGGVPSGGGPSGGVPSGGVPPRSAPSSGLPAAQATAAEAPFIALAPAEKIKAADLALLDTTVSGLELAGWGVPVEPGDVDGSVRAQLLVDSEGQALALRLLN